MTTDTKGEAPALERGGVFEGVNWHGLPPGERGDLQDERRVEMEARWREWAEDQTRGIAGTGEPAETYRRLIGHAVFFAASRERSHLLPTITEQAERIRQLEAAFASMERDRDELQEEHAEVVARLTEERDAVRRHAREQIRAALDECADNARDNGFPAAVEAIQEAMDHPHHAVRRQRDRARRGTEDPGRDRRGARERGVVNMSRGPLWYYIAHTVVAVAAAYGFLQIAGREPGVGWAFAAGAFAMGVLTVVGEYIPARGYRRRWLGARREVYENLKHWREQTELVYDMFDGMAGRMGSTELRDAAAEGRAVALAYIDALRTKDASELMRLLEEQGKPANDG